jgi:predicted deacylase
MKSVEAWPLPAASPGTSRSLKIVRYGTEGARPKVYIQAGLHADEAPGFVVLHHLTELLDQASKRGIINGEIIVVPVANPIGLSQWRDESLNGRFDFSNSVNFNRNHSDLVKEVAEQISARLGPVPQKNIDLIRDCMSEILSNMSPEDEAGHLKHKLLSLSHDADIVLDLHCDLQASMHLYLGTALWPEGTDLAAYMGAEAILLAADSGGTPFDEANSRIWWALAEKFPDHPIPPACFAVTVELRGISDTDGEMTKRDADNLYSFLQNRDSIGSAAPEPPELRSSATPLTGVDYIKAEVPGIITYLKQVGSFVKKGETIAEIINPLAEQQDDKIYPVRSSAEGILFSRNVDRFARPGRIMAKVAGTQPLREDNGNLLTL